MISLSHIRARARVISVVTVALLPIVVTGAESQNNSAIKYVYSLDYPRGQKDAYLEWVGSIGGDLQAPEELRRITSYDSYYAASPHRVIEFEFDDMAAATAYFGRYEISRLLGDVVNRGTNVTIMILQRRGDYESGARRAAVKFVYTVDYAIGERDSYLRWVTTVADQLSQAPGLAQLTAYENYFSAQPHRIIEFEFDDMVTAARYFEQPAVRRVFDEVLDQGINGQMAVLQLRGDYQQR